MRCLRILALGLAGAALGGWPAQAGDIKDKSALTGVWMQTGGQVKIDFSDKGVMKVFPHGDSDVIVVICKYSAGKDGRVKAKITELDGKAKDKAKDKLPVDLEFSFQWRVKDDTATLADLQGEKTELLKSHLEGQYDKK